MPITTRKTPQPSGTMLTLRRLTDYRYDEIRKNNSPVG